MATVYRAFDPRFRREVAIKVLLLGDFPGSPIQVTLDNSGDLQPFQTDVYVFPVNAAFCDMTSFRLTKPAGPGGDYSSSGRLPNRVAAVAMPTISQKTVTAWWKSTLTR